MQLLYRLARIIDFLALTLAIMIAAGGDSPRFTGQSDRVRLFTRDIEFQPAAGRWYPNRILYEISLELTKRYIFAPNEHSRFDVNQVFAVNRLEVEKPVPVEKPKRFNPSKPIGEQVHNDRDLTWDQVNVVRPSAGS